MQIISKKTIHKSTVQYTISDVLNFITAKKFFALDKRNHTTLKITIHRSRVTANLPRSPTYQISSKQCNLWQNYQYFIWSKTGVWISPQLHVHCVSAMTLFYTKITIRRSRAPRYQSLWKQEICHCVVRTPLRLISLCKALQQKFCR